jgi:hypothetical protein
MPGASEGLLARTGRTREWRRRRALRSRFCRCCKARSAIKAFRAFSFLATELVCRIGTTGHNTEGARSRPVGWTDSRLQKDDTGTWLTNMRSGAQKAPDDGVATAFRRDVSGTRAKWDLPIMAWHLRSSESCRVGLRSSRGGQQSCDPGVEDRLWICRNEKREWPESLLNRALAAMERLKKVTEDLSKGGRVAS